MSHATAPTTGATLTGLGDLSPVHKAYLGFMSRYDGATHALYERHLKYWFLWCASRGVDPLAIERTHIEVYVRERLATGIRASTMHTEMTPVKGFYMLAFVDGVIDRDPAVHIRLPKVHRAPKKAALDRRELARLLMVAKEVGPRHWALMQLLGVMALRIGEALSITSRSYGDVEQGYHVLRFVGKGSKPASMPLPPPVLRALEAAAAASPSELLVCRTDGGPLHRSSAAGLIRTVAHQAGLERVPNPHLIRASCITQAFDAGLSTRDVQNLARHDDPRTTSRHYDLGRTNHDAHAVHTLAARFAA